MAAHGVPQRETKNEFETAERRRCTLTIRKCLHPSSLWAEKKLEPHGQARGSVGPASLSASPGILTFKVANSGVAFPAFFWVRAGIIAKTDEAAENCRFSGRLHFFLAIWCFWHQGKFLFLHNDELTFNPYQRLSAFIVVSSFV